MLSTFRALYYLSVYAVFVYTLHDISAVVRYLVKRLFALFGFSTCNVE